MRGESDMEDNREWRYCVVGNIVETRIDENGILRYGTSAFTGGTKVYLCGKYWDEAYKTITVIGLNRFRKIAVSDVPPSAIINVRCQRTFKSRVLEIMDNFEFRDCWWGNTKKKRNQLSFLLKNGTNYLMKNNKITKKND